MSDTSKCVEPESVRVARPSDGHSSSEAHIYLGAHWNTHPLSLSLSLRELTFSHRHA